MGCAGRRGCERIGDDGGLGCLRGVSGLRLTGSQYIVLAPKHTERTAGQGRLAGLRVGIAAASLSRGGAERAAAHWAAAADDHGAEARFFAVESSDESYALPERVSLTVAGKPRLRDTAHVIRALERFAASCDVIAAFQS